jgi:membrane fusion protein (multidrug efflux system)
MVWRDIIRMEKIMFRTPAFQRAAIVLALAASAGLLSCRDEAASVPGPPNPVVGVVAVTAQTVPDEPEFIGQTEASRIIEIRPQVTGIIKERYFSEGRDVKKGDKLYQIDPIPFQAAYLSAKAKVSQAQARLVQARQNLDRVKPLLEEQAVSKKDLDDAVAEELSAKAALEGARADVIKAKFDLDNTVILAPANGLIERTRVYEGRLVTAQSDLLTIVHQVDPMYVIVSAPESFLLKRRQDAIAMGLQHPGRSHLKGTIIFADGTTYAHDGVLDFADVGLKTETGSRQARFVFPNPDRVLLPGQFVTVRFKGTVKENVILVPQRAVQQGPQGPIVFVVAEGDKAEIRPVKASSWQEKHWIIEEGVRPGERVIVDGFHTVAPGGQVKPMPVADPVVVEQGPNGTPVGGNHAAEGKPAADAKPTADVKKEKQ